MKKEFSLAFNEVLDDKQLPRDVIVGALEAALVSAYRKTVNASTAQQIEARINESTGEMQIYAEKEVVEEVQDQRTEVTLEDARKENPEAQLDDLVMVESTPEDFGRVAAQAARQMIQQRIREAERSAQKDHFSTLEGEIVNGVVQAANPHMITIGLDRKAEGKMPRSQQIPGERFRVHDRVRALLLEVKDTTRGPEIILTRAHKDFLRRLLEDEVPEIYQGLVEIRSIAREPGYRSKVAVSALQAGIDPVGACVGMRGVRIQAIVRELHDEKIDVIEWNSDPSQFIAKALSPARVTGVYLEEETGGGKTATVVVPEDQLSLAIGRDGQNARLAAKLTGWRIDIKSLTEAAGDALQKLQSDAELSTLMPNAVEAIPSIEESLAKKAENRPLTPEEFTALAQFVDRVERRTIQIKEEAARAEGAVADAHSDIPTAAFGMPLEKAGIKEHTFNILVEAGYDTVGSLMATLKADSNRVLGLAGIGPKAMQNIEEALAAIQFPETLPAEGTTASPVEAASLPVEEQTIAVTEIPPVEKPISTKKEARKVVEEDEDEHAKDGVSLDELFSMKPEIFQTAGGDDESADNKKKGKKVKKKSVELVLDEERGEVVGRKNHKRGGDDFGEEE